MHMQVCNIRIPEVEKGMIEREEREEGWQAGKKGRPDWGYPIGLDICISRNSCIYQGRLRPLMKANGR